MKISKSIAMALCMVIALGMSTSANAATMSISTTTPTVDGADIAQLVGLSDAGGDSGHLWSNRPDQGQTFTTGNDASAYLLNSVTLLARVDQSQTTSPNWEIRVGSVDGSNVLTVVSTENAAGVSIPNTSGTTNPQWVTWTFDTPITLSADALFAFDAFPNGSGFISLNNTGDVYDGGTAISNDDNLPASPPNPLTLRNFDRVFHLDLVAIPEPATATLALFGLVGLATRRRRA